MRLRFPENVPPCGTAPGRGHAEAEAEPALAVTWHEGSRAPTAPGMGERTGARRNDGPLAEPPAPVALGTRCLDFLARARGAAGVQALRAGALAQPPPAPAPCQGSLPTEGLLARRRGWVLCVFFFQSVATISC